MLGFTDYFWRLIPANPILLRVVETAGKRKRDLIIRCAYLGLLVFVVLISLNTGSTDLGTLNKTSTSIFQNLSYLQLGLVALLAPIFTAGAITQEKDSQTYDILLATPLTNGQILLGSLLSRMFFVVALLISGIPIFSITQIFGGVHIWNIVESFLISAATAFVTGALAMAIATFKVGTRRTIFSFYLFIVLYMVGLFLIDRLDFVHPVLGLETDTTGKLALDKAGSPIPIYAQISWITGLHPFLALRTIFGDKSYTPPLFADLPENLRAWPYSWYFTNPASFFITFMFTFSLLLVMPSIIFLRRLAQSNFSFGIWILTTLRLSTGDRTRKPRTVWNNPIAWREARTKASAGRTSMVRYGFIAAGLAGALFLVIRFSSTKDAAQYIDTNSYDANTGILTIYNKTSALRYPVSPETQVQIQENDNTRPGTLDDLHGHYAIAQLATNGAQNILATVTLTTIPREIPEKDVRNYLLGAVVLELAIILLIVTNAAASTVTREKEDGTLDLLLTTPITSRYYIWGKLSGLVGFVVPLVAVPVISVLMFIFYDVFRVTNSGGTERWIVFPEAVLIMPATLIIVAAFAAILGMQMSLRCRTTVMAVMSSLGIVVGICAALGWCGYSMLNLRNVGGFGLVFSSFSPFTILTLLINPYQFAESVFDQTDVSSDRIMMFVSSIAAVGAYTAIVWAMYKSMVKNFDMTIRRQSR